MCVGRSFEQTSQMIMRNLSPSTHHMSIPRTAGCPGHHFFNELSLWSDRQMRSGAALGCIERGQLSPGQEGKTCVFSPQKVRAVVRGTRKTCFESALQVTTQQSSETKRRPDMTRSAKEPPRESGPPTRNFECYGLECERTCAVGRRCEKDGWIARAELDEK